MLALPAAEARGLSACAAPQRMTLLHSVVWLLQLSPGAPLRASLQPVHLCPAFGRWTDAVPYPEWELVTDEEPDARDGGSAGNGLAAEMVDAGPTTSQAVADSHAAGPGDAEQARGLGAAVGLL